MSGIIAELLTVANFSNNKVVGGANFSDSTTLHKIACAAGQRMFVYRIHTYRSDSSTLDATIKDVADDIVIALCDEAAGTGYFEMPTSSGAVAGLRVVGIHPIILEAGDYIEFAFGVAQGATAIIAAQTLTIEI